MPVVALHHGIFGFDELRLGPLRFPQFPGIPAALQAAGHTAIVTRVHPTASIPRRAEQLKASLLRQLSNIPEPAQPVVLIAHSLGGLDARFMLAHLDMARHISALLTISTPHRGASLADLCLHHLDFRLRIYRAIESLGLDLGAARDLTRPAMARFNRDTPDHPDVRYFSITCAAPRSAIRPKFRLSHHLIEKQEGPNDGMVAPVSSRWGTHLAHWEMDHLSAINRRSPNPLALLRGRAENHPIIPELYLRAVREIAY